MESNAEETKTLDKSLYVKIPVWKKCAFGGIDTANNLSWSYIASFLMYYLTDSFLIPMAYVSTMFLICRFWDAVNDPIVGMLADRTRSRWGRYRPWIFFGTVPLFALSALLFWPHPEWALSSKLIYVYTIYALVVLAYTCVNLTYGSLNSVITQDPSERGSIASYRLTFAYIGATAMIVIVSYVRPVIDAQVPNMGYFILALCFMVVGVPLQIFGAAVQKEVVPPSKHQKIPLGTLLKYSFKNKPFLQVSAMHFIMGFSGYALNAINVYWFTYIYHDAAFFGTITLIVLLPSMIGCFTAQFFADRFKSKGKAVAVAYLGLLVFNIIAFFLFRTTINSTLLIIMSVIIAYFSGVGMSMLYGIVPDTIEYSQLIGKGIRMDGFLNTLCSFWNKVGITLGTACAGWILAATGYVQNAATQNGATSTALQLLKWIMPAAFAAIMLIFCSVYKLDYKNFNSMVAELQEKRREWKASGEEEI